MPNNEIRDIEQQIHTLMEKLTKLQQSNRGNEVTNYNFSTLNGETALMDLFEERINCCLFIICGKAVVIVHSGQMDLIAS